MTLDRLIAPQRGYLFPWVPVCLALGIGGYFALPVEPGLWTVRAVALAAALLAGLSLRAAESVAPVLLALALVATGGALAAWRTADVAAPVLGFRYYGPIEGRIVEIDRSASDQPRITLDRVVLADTPATRTPATVRVSLHGRAEAAIPSLVPGLTVILTGHLSPPMGPAEPGGFDFRRFAWFERLGAVGYTRTPVLALEPADLGRPALWLASLRTRLATAIRAEIPGQAGAFAAAVSTGDRFGLSVETLTAMRVSNLAHILSISGLHMGLLAGFVFAVIRAGVALVPWLALRVDGRKIAAVVAIAAAAAYLAVSGGDVPTQRSALMVAVMLCAVLCDRRALSVRSVALAGLAILLIRPEHLLNVGFQMSFAATVALVAAFEAQRGVPIPAVPRLLRPAMTLMLSSLVAGLATAPIGAAAFNQYAQYGLLANLIAVPAMGLVVMPAAVIAACLAPLGLAGPALWAMGVGCDWVLWVAHLITALPGARVPVMAPGPWVLPVMALGGLVLVLWRGRGRWSGVAAIAAALALWSGTERPAVLIAESGALVGVIGPGGRVLNKPKGDGFAARSWLEDDGDPRDPATAAASPAAGGFVATLPGLKLRQLSAAEGKRVADPCAGVDLLVTVTPVAAQGCHVITPETLARTGAVAIRDGPAGLRVTTANQAAGQRPWVPAAREVPAVLPASGRSTDRARVFRMPPAPAHPGS